eukprot:4815759-Amphidinium_carterae.1
MISSSACATGAAAEKACKSACWQHLTYAFPHVTVPHSRMNDTQHEANKFEQATGDRGTRQ